MPTLRRFLLITVLILCSAAAGARNRLSIAVQPLGRIGESTVQEVKVDISGTFDCRVTVLPRAPLPASAYYSPRRRYRAGKLLAFLERHTPGSFDKVIGLTLKDISTTKGKYPDWGIFGYGEIGGRACVVSTYRLKFHRPGAALMRRRLRILVLHEIGHTLGLRHCPTRGCVMQDCKGTIRTVDASTGRFCSTCRSKIRRWPKVRRRSSATGAGPDRSSTESSSGRGPVVHGTHGARAAAPGRNGI